MQSGNGPECSRTVVYSNSIQSVSGPVGIRTIIYSLVIVLWVAEQ